MAQTDSYQYLLTTQSPEAAQHYRDGQSLMLAAWPGAKEQFEAAISLDPEFALAFAALARWFAMHAQPDAARAAINRASELAQVSTERERSHIARLIETFSGSAELAISGVLQHLDTWPRDVVILSLPLGAFGLYAFSGMRDHNQAKAELCTRLAPQFASDDWWFLTYHGWSIAENGEVSSGRAMLERAMSIRDFNANGAHALAHCMAEAGESEPLARFISDWLPKYDRSGILHGHIAWHKALAHLDGDEPEAAQDIYKQFVCPDVSMGMPINVVSDSASYLWRRDLYGYPADSEDWRSVSDVAQASFPKAGHAFIDTHVAMAMAGAGDLNQLTKRLSDMEYAASASSHEGHPIAVEISKALAAISAADYSLAVTLLEPLLDDVSRIGGSNAQREVIEDTCIVVLMKSGQSDQARTALEQRLSRRPSARDERWLDQ